MTNQNAATFPLYATIFTAIGVLILCSLGTWQLQRGAWKADILAGLDAAYSGQDTPQNLLDQTPGEGGFLYGYVEGRFEADKALLLGPRTRDGAVGADVIVPLLSGDQTIFVNMGWSDETLPALPIHHVQGKTVRFEGLARRPDWNRFTPDNIPAEHKWYKPDLVEMAAAQSLPAPAPYMLYAERASYKFDAALPNNRRWRPNDNHHQYALFWFSMAGALLVVFWLRFLRRT